MLISASIGLFVRILLYAPKIEGSIKQTTGIAIPKIPTDPAIMPSDVMGIPTQQIDLPNRLLSFVPRTFVIFIILNSITKFNPSNAETCCYPVAKIITYERQFLNFVVEKMVIECFFDDSSHSYDS